MLAALVLPIVLASRRGTLARRSGIVLLGIYPLFVLASLIS